ncbi:hypothetical protein K7640_21690 [Micromonospora sp. PLK6-60]|uniref:hypothetical protein n=1 Tax=Micromonospora sp. PLK6-60 TaxID=2873383 RepID=UPI001CA62DE0|nr:hypothetical protein [Micromonospora sp. PLK6-60]MBY8874446.1 hypothetical protein [Micromonospora sp. PLK6-60]
MSRDLAVFYRSLASEADGQRLDPPNSVRTWADRRARRRAATGALGVALLVAGVGVGVSMALAPAERDPISPPAATAGPTGSPVPSPSAAPSGSPSAVSPPPSPSGGPSSGTPPKPPTRIPDGAFFTQPAGTAAEPPRFVEGERALPDLCGARLDEPVRSRTRLLVHYLRPHTEAGWVPDGTYLHTVAVHRSGAAAGWLEQLRQAVRDCPEQAGGSGPTYRVRLLTGGGYGDGSVLFEMRTRATDGQGAPAGGDEVRLIRAIRVGDVVTVLWERGWENGSSDRANLDDYSRRAVRAIEDWLG